MHDDKRIYRKLSWIVINRGYVKSPAIVIVVMSIKDINITTIDIKW